MDEIKNSASSSQEIYYETGKRKSAVARVYLRKGKGLVTVNNKPINEYFPLEHLRLTGLKPLEMTKLEGKFDIIANIRGGGFSSQAQALRHGLSRAILKYNDTFRKSLKDTGFLTRDQRMKERKKYGQKGARARYQFSKR